MGRATAGGIYHNAGYRTAKGRLSVLSSTLPKIDEAISSVSDAMAMAMMIDEMDVTWQVYPNWPDRAGLVQLQWSAVQFLSLVKIKFDCPAVIDEGSGSPGDYGYTKRQPEDGWWTLHIQPERASRDTVDNKLGIAGIIVHEWTHASLSYAATLPGANMGWLHDSSVGVSSHLMVLGVSGIVTPEPDASEAIAVDMMKSVAPMALGSLNGD